MTYSERQIPFSFLTLLQEGKHMKARVIWNVTDPRMTDSGLESLSCMFWYAELLKTSMTTFFCLNPEFQMSATLDFRMYHQYTKQGAQKEMIE